MNNWRAPLLMAALALAGCEGQGLNRLDAGYSEEQVAKDKWFSDFYGTTRSENDYCSFYGTCPKEQSGFYTRGGIEAESSGQSYDSGW